MQQTDWKNIVFVTFLVTAAWQDLRRKSVSLWLYLGYGAAAGVIRLTEGNWGLPDIGGLTIGLALLAVGRLTGGAIGSGDGWFFVISGLYLSLFNNVRLLLNGVLFGGVFCLLLLIYGKMQGRDMKKKTVPFLPFLIPAWIWMVIS